MGTPYEVESRRMPTTLFINKIQEVSGIGIGVMPRSDTFIYTYFLSGCKGSKMVFMKQNSLLKANTAKAY
jgi:hypothetical protein